MNPSAGGPREGRGGDGAGQGDVHVSVLLDEVVRGLALRPGLTVVDGTVGAAGHARQVARALGGDGWILGLDRDEEILAHARARLDEAAPAGVRVSLHHLPFSRMEEALSREGLDHCDRVLLDLGVSSLQLDDPARGFSFMADSGLDMRMDPSAGPTAEEWLARVPEAELARVIFEYGDERHSRRIARSIVAARQHGGVRTTGQLEEAIRRAVPAGGRAPRRGQGRGPARRGIHPATRTFQAIRMAVNDEMGELERGLDAALRVLGPGGRLAVIAFHSGEDRVVKNFMRDRMQRITKKPIRPGDEEVHRNPRARSARLRIAEVNA